MTHLAHPTCDIQQQQHGMAFFCWCLAHALPHTAALPFATRSATPPPPHALPHTLTL